MRKFKIRAPQQLTPAIRKKAESAALARSSEPQPAPQPSALKSQPSDSSPPSDPSFSETMDAAFPPHLRGTISGCCDNMADGHG